LFQPSFTLSANSKHGYFFFLLMVALVLHFFVIYSCPPTFVAWTILMFVRLLRVAAEMPTCSAAFKTMVKP
jgi:hypothetical protein